GLINYSRGRSLVDRFLPRDLSERDPDYARKAFYDFQKVVKNYPNSRYAGDAKQRMVYLRNVMAKYEINVADYYMRRGAYLAAANRAEYVLKNYEQTTSVPQALVIAVKAYRKLNLTRLAGDTLRVLELNFPKEAATVRSPKS
ncbi:MAG: outer membrane protein assembly factor BamD, partial [Gammaproteobacteria bacterium]